MGRVAVAASAGGGPAEWSGAPGGESASRRRRVVRPVPGRSVGSALPLTPSRHSTRPTCSTDPGRWAGPGRSFTCRGRCLLTLPGPAPPPLGRLSSCAAADAGACTAGPPAPPFLDHAEMGRWWDGPGRSREAAIEADVKAKCQVGQRLWRDRAKTLPVRAIHGCRLTLPLIPRASSTSSSLQHCVSDGFVKPAEGLTPGGGSSSEGRGCERDFLPRRESGSGEEAETLTRPSAWKGQGGCGPRAGEWDQCGRVKGGGPKGLSLCVCDGHFWMTEAWASWPSLPYVLRNLGFTDTAWKLATRPTLYVPTNDHPVR